MKRCSRPFYNLFADNRDAVLHRTVSLQGATADERRADGHLALAVVAVLLHQLRNCNLLMSCGSADTVLVDCVFLFTRCGTNSSMKGSPSFLRFSLTPPICMDVPCRGRSLRNKLKQDTVPSRDKKVHRRVCINKNNMIFHETRLEYESSLSFDRF